MRILNKGAFNYSLKDLGFVDNTLDHYRELLTRPYGMILVSGPTGSGKSTTLYASLKEICRPDRKLLTVEDPIEYEMPGISQVQVNLSPREQEKKVTFAKVLREFLRQDPDVILVGEIRDRETAAISVQAALTGHLLLSTIHTNDAVGIVTRLKDMGIEPYLVGSVLVGGIAQRLVRKVCSNCKYEVPVTKTDQDRFDRFGIPVTSLYEGRGCDACHNYGYRGRVAIYEILTVTAEIGELISSGANASEIKRLAIDRGMKLLVHDALVKAAAGIITKAEVNRVTVS
jgi:type IV pilus assembly protein PilB